jgi:hypothetical protein
LSFSLFSLPRPSPFPSIPTDEPTSTPSPESPPSEEPIDELEAPLEVSTSPSEESEANVPSTRLPESDSAAFKEAFLVDSVG